MHGADITATFDVPDASPSVPETSLGGVHAHALSAMLHDAFGQKPISQRQLSPCSRIRKSSGRAPTLTAARSRRVEPVPPGRCVVEESNDLSDFFEGGKA